MWCVSYVRVFVAGIIEFHSHSAPPGQRHSRTGSDHVGCHFPNQGTQHLPRNVPIVSRCHHFCWDYFSILHCPVDLPHIPTPKFMWSCASIQSSLTLLLSFIQLLDPKLPAVSHCCLLWRECSSLMWASELLEYIKVLFLVEASMFSTHVSLDLNSC